MLNQARLEKLIADMSESIGLLEECIDTIQVRDADKIALFMVFGLKQLFVDFFITVEDFTSMMLKEKKRFKIGMDMKGSLDILKEEGIIEDDLYQFLQEARLLRNRIAHRYKEPSREELMDFIQENRHCFDQVLKLVKVYVA